MLEIFFISSITFVASFFGTIAGFGSSTMMLPILFLFLPYSIALMLVGIIHFFDDIWEIILFRRAVNWKLLLFFGVPGVITSILGARLAIFEQSTILLQILGVLLLFYAFLIVSKPKFKIPNTNLSASLGGTLSGFIAGTFGIGGPIRAMFLSSFNLTKETYLFTSGVIALLIDPARLITYFLGGVTLKGTYLWGLLLFIPITFIGSRFAKSLINKISQKKFRKLIAGFLFISGLKLILFP